MLENDLAYLVRDRYPASPGHLLILPRRQVADWFEATAQERMAMMELQTRPGHGSTPSSTRMTKTWAST